MPITATIDAAGFQALIQAKADKLRDGAQKAIVAYAQTLLQELASNTPIATGQARANWQAGLNEVPTAFLPNGTSLHLPQTVAWEAYIAASAANLDEYVSGDTIFISNSAPYILALDAGRSSQGSGFIEAALQSAQLDLEGLDLDG